ncbi:MAG TPA: trypsin-like peptidase domain-containing protein [Jatrophihabitans sp.]|nr:trypsin-like peptidase domain-containing protein [Jatrophihabitans sp.]
MREQQTPQNGADDPGARVPEQPPAPPYYPAASYPEGAYAQGSYAPGTYPQGSYPQGAYPQGSYPQAGSDAGYQQTAWYPQGYQPYSDGGYPPGGYPPPYGYWAPPPVPPRKHPHRFWYGAAAAAVAAAVAAAGITAAVTHSSGSSSQASVNTPSNTSPFSNGNSGSGPDQFGQGGSSGQNSTGTATATQSVGIVDINTVLDYGQGKAAGTGIVLNSGGEVLTNTHVIEDSTQISVTVVSTGKTYTAKVVGTDPSDDVAVIQLQDANGLATAKLGNSSSIKVGSSVTAVGNAGGTGGTPSAATGTVTALNQSITASDGNGSNAERLTGMIEVDADVQAGDSGGALYDNSNGTIVGVNTAASNSSSRFQTNLGTTGFAIPIEEATKIAGQISDGTDNATIHQGYPAFLGVQLSSISQASGAAVSGVIPGSGAANAGLAAGDVITTVNGDRVSDGSALSSVMHSHNPGDKISIGFTDPSGAGHTVTVTLGEGPAD